MRKKKKKCRVAIATEALEYILLLQQQSQSRHQHVLSNLIPWLTASQLLQTQSRLQHAQAAAVLQQQETSQLSPSVSDMADGTTLIQRTLLYT